MPMIQIPALDSALESKYQALLAILRRYKTLLVAYSGGVDSALILKAATEALGPERAVGVIARSETLTEDEFEDAAAVAREHAFNLRVIQYSELEIENYATNPTNRCYFCKAELYGRLQDVAREIGAEAICNGDNLDDVGDWRPGMKAAAEFQVISPLREAQLRKADIRALARALGLSNWDKPSGACLSSRVPYGDSITREKLTAIGRAEKLVRELGVRQARVRHHGEIARIEVGAEDIARLADPNTRAKIVEGMKALGFQYIALDLEGYRTGSLNETLRKPDRPPSNAGKA